MPALSAIRGRARFTVSSIIDLLRIRIANDPELPLGQEPKEVRALLGIRVLIMLANSLMDPQGVFSPTPRHRRRCSEAPYSDDCSRKRVSPMNGMGNHIRERANHLVRERAWGSYRRCQSTFAWRTGDRTAAIGLLSRRDFAGILGLGLSTIYLVLALLLQGAISAERFGRPLDASDAAARRDRLGGFGPVAAAG